MELNQLMVNSSERIDPPNHSAFLHGAAARGDHDQGAVLQSTPSARPPADEHSRTAAPPHQHSSTSSSSSDASTPMFVASPAGNSSRRDLASASIAVAVDGPGQREKALKSLKESIPHAMRLQQLQKLERQFQKDGSWYKRGVRRLSKEMYVITSLYALIQSALFAAVSQTSLLQCEDWWAPLCMSGLVTLGTLASVLDKLHRMGKEQEQVSIFQARQNAVYDVINELQWRGADCDLDFLLPHHEVTPLGLNCVFSPHGFLILGFLLGFSLLLIISCFRILCQPHCNCPSL